MKKFILIAGPCVIEDKKSTLEIASYLKEVTSKYPLNFIFKASFDKANRTSLKSYRGPGLKKGIKILEEVKKKFSVSILSDVHCRYQVREVKDVLDVIQIPAFLSRQTDLILEVAKTKKTVNVKKAQFMSPYDIKYVIEKITSVGNNKIFLTERGSCFGYNNLVVDFRSLLIMKKFEYPVIFDATHSLQRPSAKKGVSGGDRKFVLPMSLAAVACGCDGLFLEVHPHPQRALSDRYTSFPLNRIDDLIKKVLEVRRIIDEK
ncbi:MAG: 3-deoxy-8-phosphooctulonate synthase [Candidatus Omnitrophota bacterium]|nr:MAG: 3-deoxy-8-phosphooctulonate synthase [Candidatus Omnitrophota bacterium]RKY46369.1 MAG: 3-deoxy-8-phosphooctulonate synthase [Candidatus Omnitrophota bacterium]HDN86354.1 3-deoxy-8-phosphooctulonate synthase [Candidatus Omnitrophota bacterium]